MGRKPKRAGAAAVPRLQMRRIRIDAELRHQVLDDLVEGLASMAERQAAKRRNEATGGAQSGPIGEDDHSPKGRNSQEPPAFPGCVRNGLAG